MNTALRKRFTVALVAVVATMSVAVMPAQVAAASPTSISTAAPTASVIDDGASKLLESKAVQWLLDNIAITEMQLSPSMKRLVNWVIKLALPVMCPVLGQAAAPKYATAITNACLKFGENNDPWAAIVKFTPYLCGFGWLIFPDYYNVLKLACKALQ